MKRDHVTACISLIIGVVVAIATWQIPSSHMSGDVGPKIFPAICAAGLIIPGIGLLIQKPADNYKENYSRQEIIKLGIISAVVIVYAVLMDLIGFIIPTVVVLFVLSTMFSRGMKIAIWKKIGFSVLVTAGIYFAFEKVMLLQLPQSRLF